VFSKELELSISQAYQEARERRHEFLTVEHMLLALLDNASALSILSACGADIASLEKDLRKVLDDTVPLLKGEDNRDTQPTIGFQAIRNRLSFGAGLIVNRTVASRMRVHLVPDPGDPFGLPPYPAGVAFVDETIDGSGWGVGFNLGTMARMDQWSFGLSFQSQITHKLDGESTTRFWSQKVDGRGELGDPLIEQDLLAGRVHRAIQDIEFETTLPPVLTFGLAFFPGENLRFTGDLAYTWYSQVPGVIVTSNDDVTFKFGDPQDVHTTVTVNSSEYNQWEDQWRVSVGAEWDALPRVHLRGGFYYEPAVAQASTLTPLYWDISNKLSPSFGVSFDIGSRWVLSYAYGAVFHESRAAETWTADNLAGQYGGLRHESYFAFQVKL